jgi:hypothetical protein
MYGDNQDHAARQDLEAQLAAVCKDNTILLQRLRDTATVSLQISGISQVIL